MSKKILIDAGHQEEVRLAVCNNTAIEEFDYQSQVKKSTKGNIYLAKVTRVEPSLQAAFVDYGSEKHGFLSFAEIHPDYYQIPIADRQRLLEELRRADKADNESKTKPITQDESVISSNLDTDELQTENLSTANRTYEEAEMPEDEQLYINHLDTDEESSNDRPQFYKRYKIQEVIKKGQIILIQIEKEERGNKGASLTTYISLAGRFCVYMPNATKGGGVSRKIADDQDRQRLKKISTELTQQELDNQGTVIIRTAGAYKTKTEIKRDLQYLQKLWDNIRELTVKSTAPAFIYEEGDVIKKAIRDLYDSDIDEIIIQGTKAHNDAVEFMKLILPRHVNKLKLYSGNIPLFASMKIEEKIAELHNHKVALRSGGYIVINHTEALVAIDVNSGRATSERNIEDTALKTNLEAAEEIARQLRLRDLSGLIVIDFIDMEELRNKKSVERVLKEALHHDKAKIQVGRISSFGLLEMSRQRLKQNFLESNSEICNYCNGRGRVRHIESTAIVVIRALETEIAQGLADEIKVSGSSQLMFYILNNKRAEITALEQNFGGKIIFYTDESAGGDGFFIEKKKSTKKPTEEKTISVIDQSIYESVDRQNENRLTDQKAKQHKMKFKSSRNKFQHQRNANKNIVENNEKPTQPIQTFEERTQANIEKEQSYFHKNKPTTHHEHSQKRKKFKDNKKVRNDYPRNLPSDEISEDNYDQEMALRRKENQSLLKEIWKKIVD